MPRRTALAAALLLFTVAAALAAPPLKCSRDLGLQAPGLEVSGPTDVGVDPDGILYVLYGREGRLELMRTDGRLLQARGEEGADRPPARMTPCDLYVGADGPATLLAAEEGETAPGWLLRLSGSRLKARRLKDAPDLRPPAVGAPGPEGRYYVLSGGTLHAFGESGGLQYRAGPLSGGLTAPRQMALDRHRNVFVLDAEGLKVFSPKAALRWSLPGARAFYLAGDDRLVAAGGDWVKKFATDGRMLVQATRVPGASGRLPVAASLSADGTMFVYYRDPTTGGGLVVRLDPRGEYLEEFLQPPRFPPSPDPGYRLDSRGRLYYWDTPKAVLVRLHPGGRTEVQAGFAPNPGDAKGHLLRPSDLAVDSRGVAWIADSGNYRLQRFDRDSGWLSPIPVGIRGGPAQAEPRQVAFDSQGTLLTVTHPPAGQGQVVLQRRGRDGRLLFEQDLGPAAGDPVVKLAVTSDGSVFLYRAAGTDNPVLAKLDSRGRTVARVGGEDRNFHLPGQPFTRITVKHEEDMIPWGKGVILPAGGKLLFVNSRLEVTAAREVQHRRGSDGARVSPDFGGGAVSGGRMLYLADLANACLHRIPLP